MTDEIVPMPAPVDTPAAKIKKAAQATGVGGTLVLAITTLPDPYREYAVYILAGCAIIGFTAMFIPAPVAGSKLWPLYRILSFLAANAGETANAAILIRQSRLPKT